MMLLTNSMRYFSASTRKVGHNNFIKDEKLEAKKYGIKRRFYDHLPNVAR